MSQIVIRIKIIINTLKQKYLYMNNISVLPHNDSAGKKRRHQLNKLSDSE